MPGQGLCLLPGSALSLPGELLTAAQAEAVCGKSNSWLMRVFICCGEAAAWVRAAHSSRSSQDISDGTFQVQGQCRI